MDFYQLYHTDSYLREMDATVIHVEGNWVVQPLTVVDNSISPSRLTILHDLAYGIFEASHPLNFTS